MRNWIEDSLKKEKIDTLSTIGEPKRSKSARKLLSKSHKVKSKSKKGRAVI